MKKRWFLSLLAATGGGIYVVNKLIKKEKNQKDSQRTALTEHYEKQGYKVHMYNENNDFMLFHHEKNEKKHVFYDDGLIPYDAFRSKLQAYYFHFTNEFYIICKDEEILTKSTESYHEWVASLDEKTVETYGNPMAYFQTVDELQNQ